MGKRVLIFEMMKKLKQEGYLNQEKRLKKEMEAVFSSYIEQEIKCNKMVFVNLYIL